MTKIIISNAEGDVHHISEDFESKNISGLYHLVNTREIGISIAYAYFDAEYDIKQEFLDEDINDALADIHEKILEAAIQTLEENNREVL